MYPLLWRAKRRTQPRQYLGNRLGLCTLGSVGTWLACYLRKVCSLMSNTFRVPLFFTVCILELFISSGLGTGERYGTGVLRTPKVRYRRLEKSHGTVRYGSGPYHTIYTGPLTAARMVCTGFYGTAPYNTNGTTRNLSLFIACDASSASRYTREYFG